MADALASNKKTEHCSVYWPLSLFADDFLLSVDFLGDGFFRCFDLALGGSDGFGLADVLFRGLLGGDFLFIDFRNGDDLLAIVISAFRANVVSTDERTAVRASA